MIILGIDPGTRSTGYGLIRTENNKYIPIDYGSVRPPASMTLSDRYLAIYQGITELLDRFVPDAVSVETQFVKNNPQSAIKLGMARGVIILAARQHSIPIYEYAPTKAKIAVVGNGRASKYQVQQMVKCLLNLAAPPEPEDAADALALAICHAQSPNCTGKLV